MSESFRGTYQQCIRKRMSFYQWGYRRTRREVAKKRSRVMCRTSSARKRLFPRHMSWKGRARSANAEDGGEFACVRSAAAGRECAPSDELL